MARTEPHDSAAQLATGDRAVQGRGRRRLMRALRSRRMRFFAFLGVMGPGLIAASAGNDAGGIYTYASVGAEEGYGLLWMLVLIPFSLAVVQEMCARMGAATGKGLSDLIRERFGIRLVALAMVTLFVANAGTTISEFAGIAAAMELFGVTKYVSVPLAGVLVWLLVVKGSYPQVEKVFLAMSLVFFAYPISMVLAHPDWGDAARSIIHPPMRLDQRYLYLFIATVGTTITPYMQVYVQSSTVEKGVQPAEYPMERFEVYLGSFLANAVAATILIATAATLYVRHISINTAADAAQALAPLAGTYAFILFGVGLLGASLLAAAVLPLATAYSITEAFGFEHGVSMEIGEAPVFMVLFTGLIVLGVLVTLIPGLPLGQLLILVQVLNGVLLPILLVFMIRLATDRELMGNLVSGPINRAIAVLTAGIITLLSLLLLVITLLSWFGVNLTGGS